MSKSERRRQRQERLNFIKQPPPPPINFYGRAVDCRDGRYDDLRCRPMVTARQMVSAYVLGNRYQQERIEFFKH